MLKVPNSEIRRSGFSNEKEKMNFLFFMILPKTVFNMEKNQNLVFQHNVEKII